MKKSILLTLSFVVGTLCYGQKTQTVYLNPKDSMSNMYIAVQPEKAPIKAFMFLIPGSFQTPAQVLSQTNLPLYAASKGVLTIIPMFETGTSSFGIDSDTQQSLNKHIQSVVTKYSLQGKSFYIGGFSIGGSCAVKYAELATQSNSLLKPKAVFAIDPPLDFERYYNAAKRVVRLSLKGQVNEEVPYMINRIEKEMGGTPKTALDNFYWLSPYSYSDEKQRAVKTLIRTPIMIITEPDIDWWLSQRGYDYSFINAPDHTAMINELKRLGNNRAVLVTTHNKGYRKPNNMRHPHSFSIVDNEQLLTWLQNQN